MHQKKILSLILALAMVLGMAPAALAVDAAGGGSSYNNIAVDKTAKWVNAANKTAEVTLSVKGETDAPVAIEFVLDGTSSLYSKGDATVIDTIANAVLESLKARNADTYVGITVFGRSKLNASLPMTKIDRISGREITVEDAVIRELLTSDQLGTNVEAGLRAGAEDLKNAPANAVKYMVLITDGGSYWWMNSSAAANNTYGNGVYTQNSEAADGGHELSKLDELAGANLSRSAEAFDTLQAAVADGHYTSFEKGVCFAYDALREIKTDDINLITVSRPYYKGSNMEDLAGEFIEKANALSVASFTLSEDGSDLQTGITDSTRIVLSKGSVIVDFLGKGKDSVEEDKNYDFDLVKDGEITLTVAGTKYVGRLSGNAVTFDDGSRLVYTPGIDEKIVLTLGQDLLRGQTLTLSFTEKLAGGYSEADGVHYVNTNVSAALEPAGTAKKLYFPVPKLSYRIGDDSGDGPSMLETVDHVAYIIGRDDGLIHPTAPITRAEVATIFFRLLTNEARTEYWKQSNSYSDVSRSAWYNNAISTLSNIGIINGYPDGTFGPDRTITRAELTKIAVSFFDYADKNIRYNGQFSDVTGTEWHADFVAAASELGLINGYTDGTFHPNAEITRSETCAIVNRTLGRAPDKDQLLPGSAMIRWPDNMDTNAWYYTHMQEATNTHDYTWVNGSGVRVEKWTKKLAERDWAALERVWSEANSAPGGEVMD